MKTLNNNKKKKVLLVIVKLGKKCYVGPDDWNDDHQTYGTEEN
jgi:hypothetical protein